MAIPLLIDLAVICLVHGVVVPRTRREAPPRLLAALALLAAVAAPLVAASLLAPQWVMVTTVLMMVDGFYGLATAVSVLPEAPGTLSEVARPARLSPEAVDDFLGADAWRRFERDFERYVAGLAHRDAAQTMRSSPGWRRR